MPDYPSSWWHKPPLSQHPQSFTKLYLSHLTHSPFYFPPFSIKEKILLFRATSVTLWVTEGNAKGVEPRLELKGAKPYAIAFNCHESSDDVEAHDNGDDDRWYKTQTELRDYRWKKSSFEEDKSPLIKRMIRFRKQNGSSDKFQVFFNIRFNQHQKMFELRNWQNWNIFQ